MSDAATEVLPIEIRPTPDNTHFPDGSPLGPKEGSVILRVGDTVDTVRMGEREVARLLLCPTPWRDPAGEDNGIEVDEVEMCQFFTADLIAPGLGWIYGHQITRIVARGEES